jgi:hypothetical protein
MISYASSKKLLGDGRLGLIGITSRAAATAIHCSSTAGLCRPAAAATSSSQGARLLLESACAELEANWRQWLAWVKLEVMP